MRRLLTASVALLLLSSAPDAAWAQDGRHDHRQKNRDSLYDQVRRDQARVDDRREGRQAQRDDHRWARGQRLDSRYRTNNYAVSDYRRHGLRKPPRGYRWHRVNDQYVLAAITGGLIVSVIIAGR